MYDQDYFKTMVLKREWRTGGRTNFIFPMQPYFIEWEHFEERVEEHELYYSSARPDPYYKSTCITLTVFHKFISAN